MDERGRRGLVAALDNESCRIIVADTANGLLFYRKDRHGLLRFSALNGSFLTMLGLEAAPEEGLPLEAAFPGVFPADLLAQLRRAPELAEGSLGTDLVLTLSGSTHYFLATMFPTLSGAAALVLAEVTDLRRDAEELRRARLLLERAEDMAKIGSWEFDYRTKTVTASPGAINIYGAPPTGLDVRDMEAVPLPEYRDRLDRARDELIGQGRPYDIEFRIKKLDSGEILEVHSRAAWDGTNKRLFGIIRDITEEKRAEAEIRGLNQELEARVARRTAELSAANEALGLALHDLEESQAKQILAEKMAALGRLVATLAHELNTPIGAMKSEGESGVRDSARQVEFFDGLRALSGLEYSFVRALVTGSRASSGALDLPSQRARRRALRDRLAVLGVASPALVAEELVDLDFAEAEVEGLGGFPGLAGFANLSGLVHLAWELTSSGRASAVVMEAACKAERVVRALMTYSSGGLGKKTVRTDVRRGIEEALATEARSVGGNARASLVPGAPAEVLCFPEQLEQVWLTLARNAFQAMDGRGHLDVAIAEQDDEIEVTFTDDGPGIPAAIQDRIFTPFFSTKPAGAGSGLGLDISRRILEEIEGTVAFESVPGCTRFTVKLKAAPGSN
jgi:PAS domain S-box-containing protein